MTRGLDTGAGLAPAQSRSERRARIAYLLSSNLLMLTLGLLVGVTTALGSPALGEWAILPLSLLAIPLLVVFFASLAIVNREASARRAASREGAADE